MSELELHKKLLNDIKEGLITRGYKLHGGSDVYVYIDDENENNIKIFLNDYKKPTHLNCKFSCVKEKQNEEKV